MSVEWIAVVVAIVAAGITAAFTSGFRRLADQIAGDQRLAGRIAVVTQKSPTSPASSRGSGASRRRRSRRR